MKTERVGLASPSSPVRIGSVSVSRCLPLETDGRGRGRIETKSARVKSGERRQKRTYETYNTLFVQYFQTAETERREDTKRFRPTYWKLFGIDARR